MKKTVKEKIAHRARISYSAVDDPLPKKIMMGAIEYASGRRRLEKVYTVVKEQKAGANTIWKVILDELKVGMSYDEQQLRKAPSDGPLIIVANHPFGVVDGLILGHLLSQIRSDFFVLVNEVLCREELLNPYFLPIDFRETKEALQINIQTRKLAIERLRAGSSMGIFPAGGVATVPKIGKKVQELEWKRFVVKLIQQTKATVLPVYVHGRNSHLFQLASKVHLNLRLSLLLNEVRNKMGKQIKITIGDPIPFSTVAHLKSRQELLDYLRMLTEGLGEGVRDEV